MERLDTGAGVGRWVDTGVGVDSFSTNENATVFSIRTDGLESAAGAGTRFRFFVYYDDVCYYYASGHQNATSELVVDRAYAFLVKAAADGAGGWTYWSELFFAQTSVDASPCVGAAVEFVTDPDGGAGAPGGRGYGFGTSRVVFSAVSTPQAGYLARIDF